MMGPRLYTGFEPTSSLLLAAPPSQALTCGPLADPVSAQGVTRLQADSANDMTGGLQPVVETTGDLAGGVGDGASRAARRAASAAESVSGVARGAGRLLGPAAVGLDLVAGGMKVNEAWNDRSLTDAQRDKKVGEATVGTAGSVLGGAGGAAAGAAAGAAIGSVIPGLGTVIGGIAGAVIGGFLGGKAGEKAGEAVGRTGVGRAVGDFVNDLAGR